MASFFVHVEGVYCHFSPHHKNIRPDMSAPPVQPALLELLNDSSAPYRDPLARLDWKAVDTDMWWLPPEALSLAGVSEFERLPIARRRRVSHYEFVHLLEVGLWLESLFIYRLGSSMDSLDDNQLRGRYLHEIREEAGHSLMFLELMSRSRIRLDGAARKRPRLAKQLAHWLPVSSALFWALAVVGEEFPDKLNRMVRHGVQDATVSSLIYHMATMHIIDEARHIAHARACCTEATRALPALLRLSLSPVLSNAISEFVRYLFFPSTAVYLAAGLSGSMAWRALALRNQPRRDWVLQAIAPTLEFLRAQGWRVRPPRWLAR